ncbi:MAG: UDP-N-acetylmuramoyl-L-alanine--D-glutamate ligase [Deltaproteobacteria bacterium]|nr:UDP-N-acetylmuramoyl-L-alanine--D-glutamate ligase [Deltaproteobacteria bacterium]
MDLKNKRVIIIGFAKTGRSLTRFLLRHQAAVMVNDIKVREQFNEDLSALEREGVTFVLGRHPHDISRQADLILISPGVDPNLAALTEARKQRVPIISEIELACRFIDVPIIAVTGTNGKTTTTSLIADMLRRSGFSVFMGGNIGIPLITFVYDRLQADYVVAELSSFQLETIDAFRPHVAVLLNITQDHLDRYATFGDYCAAKFRIFMNQRADDFAVINSDDARCSGVIAKLAAQTVPFSGVPFKGEGVHIAADFFYFQQKDGSRHVYSQSNVKLVGPHNRENLAAAIGAAELCGGSPDAIQESLDQFQGLEHRLEFVREIGGVGYYNDSKATNIDALLKSLQSFPGNVILIAGGREKGGEYDILKDIIRRKTRMLILLGEAQNKFYRLFSALTDTRFARDMNNAVEIALQHARGGDVVLLSPGCASFDMFSDYEERGRVFKESVRRAAARKEFGEAVSHE